MADSSDGANSGSSASATNSRLGRHARAGERIGVDERQRHDDGGRQRRHPGAVPQRGHQRRRGEVADVVGKADEAPVAVLEALRQQRGERQGDGEQQERHQREDRRRA